MPGFEMRLGSAFLTLIDPDRGAEAEFNRWYERDHLYGGALLGPGVLAGTRYLARATEKRLRVVADGEDPDRGTMLALYWIADDGSEFWRWCVPNIAALTAQGRMDAPGRVRNVWWLPDPWAESPVDDGVPPALALDRRFPAVALAIVEGAERSVDDLVADYRASCVRRISATSDVGLVVGACPQPINFKVGPVDPTGPTQVAAVWFFEQPSSIAGFVDAHEQAMAEVAGARTVWLSPFVATIPGTDTYLDQLWL